MGNMNLQTTYSSAPAIGYAGMLEGELDQDIIAMKNVEATASIPFGSAVAFKTSSPSSDLDALLPAGSTDKIAGIVAHSHAYARQWTDSDGVKHGDLDSTGLVPGTFLNVLRAGKILVPCVTGCAPADRLYVCYAAGSTYTVVGTMGNAAEASHTIDCTTQGQWLTTAAANGLAWLQVNFLNK